MKYIYDAIRNFVLETNSIIPSVTVSKNSLINFPDVQGQSKLFC